MKEKTGWIYYWQEEVDAAFLYLQLIYKIEDAEKQDRYRKLAAIENKHVLAWEGLVEEERVKIERGTLEIKVFCISFQSFEKRPGFREQLPV